MKVYDCFTFYNEFELLELRLKSLWDTVDYFVLVEADKKHTNEPKPFYFDERKSKFKKFLPKIKHVKAKLNVPFSGVGDWSLENAQRNAITNGLTDAEPEDMIFISDLDEIPAPDILQRISNRQAPVISMCPIAAPPRMQGQQIIVPCQLMAHAADLLEVTPISMEQTFHYYYFDWISKATWQGTVLTKKKNLTIPQDMRNLRNVFPKIPNGGWHFSYMGGVDRVINKMLSIVDGNELVKKSSKNLTDRKYILDCIKNGKDVYGRENMAESQFFDYDINKINLPYLRDFVKKYPQFLRTTDPGLK